MRAGRVVSVAVLVACGRSSLGPAPGPGTLALQLVSNQLNSPIFVTASPGDTARLFVVEQGGRIRVVRHDTLLSTPFLNLAGRLSVGGERGLLGLAFHPGYAGNGRFYVYFTTPLGDIRIARYVVSANPDIADSTSGDTVLTVAHRSESNHNGGMLAFGPDGKLYAGLGDGGGGGDPFGNGQNRKTLLGKILRLDVDAASPYAIPPTNPFVGDTGARGEVWLYGLRNPWRFSFDRLTGDLYVGDVGQNAWEEVDVLAAGAPGGGNYGWNEMEGSHCYAAASCPVPGLVLPVLEYGHGEGCAVTGGYVARDSTVPDLLGLYLYGDYCDGWVRSFRYVGGQATDPHVWPALAVNGGLSSFGEDARGAVYITTLSGALYRIVAQP
jgi:glucose/arabinose dehydrogenase